MPKVPSTNLIQAVANVINYSPEVHISRICETWSDNVPSIIAVTIPENISKEVYDMLQRKQNELRLMLSTVETGF
jgi:hypothetical protein